MDRELVSWLNSSHDYSQGVKIFFRLSKNDRLKQQFANGKPAEHSEMLFNELRSIFYALKGIKPVATVVPKKDETPTPVAPQPIAKNPELEAVCKLEADKAYKQLMNARALLFALCPIENTPNENSIEAMAQREDLAMSVANLQPVVDDLYNRLRYVQKHGKLPDAEPTKTDDIPSNPILLERKRVNIIKGIHKLKAKEQTPERVALIQESEELLKIVTDGVNQFLEREF